MVKALEGVAGDISIWGQYLQYFFTLVWTYWNNETEAKKERERDTVRFSWVFNLAACVPL